MLVMREEQVRVMLRDAAVERLTTKYAPFVRGLSRPQIAARVDAAFAAAASYGIGRDENLLAFATFSFVAGERFHLHPDIASRLSAAVVTADDRFDCLLRDLRPTDWARIRDAVRPGDGG